MQQPHAPSKDYVPENILVVEIGVCLPSVQPVPCVFLVTTVACGSCTTPSAVAKKSTISCKIHHC